MNDSLITKLASYGINYSDAMKRMDNDGDLYKMLALKYLDNSKMPDLIASLDIEDYDEAYKAAHSLKGVAGNLSFTKLFDVAAAMSEALFQGEYQAAKKMLPDLERENNAVVEGLTKWSDDSL